MSLKKQSNPYQMTHWGSGHFTLNAKGELEVAPNPEADARINLCALQNTLQQAGLRQPVLVRFPDILHHRVAHLANAFASACERVGYAGEYQAVYPIKVNQQRPVVEQIIQGQAQAGFEFLGLEAGSKPELIAVLALAQAAPARIICNGYKDQDYIRLALMAEKLGHQVFLVIEKPAELALILQQAKQLGVRPRLGVRARLSSIGKGNWQNSGGEKSKFGLSSMQIVNLIETLKLQQQSECLQLLHFHLGSQLANIRDIQTGLKEAARIYAELSQLALDIQWVDIGGGLGVDYEGTRSRSFCSMNYSVPEYAKNVVDALYEVCQQTGIKQPNIISESGRAMTAHHALLLTEVSDIEHNTAILSAAAECTNNELHALGELQNHLQQGFDGSLFEACHDCQHWLDNVQQAFIQGNISLHVRAQAEALVSQINQQIMQLLDLNQSKQRALFDELKEKQASKLFVNFSLFQSLPDAWGIAQIFPILPLKNLHEPMPEQAVIQDITCDSDGRINQYVGHGGLENTLSLPEVYNNMPLVFCLLGAYQEILGDMHNLFGDTDSVDVSLDAQGEVSLSHIIAGDSIRSVLDYVNYDVSVIQNQLKSQVQNSHLAVPEKQLFEQTLEAALESYTYLLNA